MPKRTYAEALQTKKNILSAAQKIIAKKGFNKASLADIAREANVTRGAVYWHFENKNELLASLCEEEASRVRLVAELQAASDENQEDPLGQLKKWMMRHFTDEAELLFNSAIAATCESLLHNVGDTNNRGARDKIVELINTRKFRIEAALRAAVVKKQLPADIDIEMASVYLNTIINGFIASLRQGLLLTPMSNYSPIIDAVFQTLPNIKRQVKPLGEQ